MRIPRMAVKKAMSLLVVFVSALLLSCTVASTEIYAANQSKGTVTAGSLNVRSGPGTNQSIVCVVKKGDPVMIVKTDDGWHKISIGKNQYGWVSADYVKLSSPEKYTLTAKKEKNATKKSSIVKKTQKAKTTQKNGTLTVTGVYTNLRKGPGLSYSVSNRLNCGTVGSVTQKEGVWYKVRLNDSKEGWVNKKYVKVTGYQATIRSTAKAQTPANKIIVASSTVNVRKQASTSSKLIGRLRKNEVYEYSGYKNGWYMIITPSGDTGYVLKDYVKPFKSYAIDGGGSYIWPTQTAKRITSYFRKTEGGHKGIDIAAPGGSQIVSVASGTVLKKDYRPNGLGYYIVIQQDDGMRAYYCHMQKESFLDKGDKVKAGDTIGVVGTTGRSTGNHLHLEFHKGSERIDPLTFFPNMAR